MVERNATTMLVLRSLWGVLDQRARRDAVVLSIFSTLSGFLETLSVGLIIPFIAASTNSGPFGASRFFTRYIQTLLNDHGVKPESATIALAAVFLSGYFCANAALGYYQYFSLKFAFREKAALSVRLLTQLTTKSLGWYEHQNSAELSKSVLADVDRVTTSLISATQLIGIVFRTGILAIFFLVVQLKLAITLAASLGLSFFIVFRLIHRPLVSAGERSLESLKKMYAMANETVAGAREIKASNTQRYFIERFRVSAFEQVTPEVTRGIPPYIIRVGLETLIITIVTCVMVWFYQKDGTLANGLPILSAYAIAGIRILPALQQALFHWVQIRFMAPSVEHIKTLLEPEAQTSPPIPEGPIQFREKIQVKGLSFAYPGSEATLTDLNLEISKNQRVAFVGTTGAGKSTLMDLLLGLRNPTSGTIQIDGTPLGPENIPSWLARVGYVPQNVYLLDGTITDNVAFGIPPETADAGLVRRACESANIAEFIQRELPLGYQATVGERGARLSGGQCQRLGIARALYHDPEVVFFDEATSSLDNVTEDAILKALESLRGKKTVIVVAHRLNTVWDFDKLFVFEKGRLVGSGTANELLASCPAFQSLAAYCGKDVDSGSEVAAH